MTPELLPLLLLIIIANGAPILIQWLLNDSFNLAVDFAQKLPDNNQLFGPSKTWRGILAALLATTAAAWLLNHSPETGLLVAIYAIVGDLCSSFIKRRLSMKPGSMAPLLDQVPESLFPAFMLKEVFNLDISAVILLVLIFIIIELLLSHILYKYGVRKKPY
jgi:predicted CDP-diglyceride synthetase/phosphatidate cytidylyltransferase